MIKIAICDDEENTLLENERSIKRYLQKIHQIAEVVTYQSGEFLLYDIKEGMFFDLIFIDIEMPGTSGMDIAKTVKKVSHETLVVFITSHSEFAIESYELSVFRYIPKNKMKDKLYTALKDAVSQINIQKDKSYLLVTPTRYEKIPYDSILYVRKESKNTVFVTSRGEIYVRKSLNQVYKELDDELFVYIDRGYVVNLMKIITLTENEVIIKNDIELHASKKRLKELRIILTDFWGERI